MPVHEDVPGRIGWAGPILAGLAFNALFTFSAVSATPWVVPAPALSAELLVGLAGLAVFRWWRPALSSVLRWAAVSVLVLAAVVRYAIVVTPAVLGRDLNARADLPHLHRVAGMFWEGMPASVLGGAIALGAVVVAGLGALCWFGCRALDRAMGHPRVRGAAIAAAAAACACLVLAEATGRPALAAPFGPTLTAQVSRQLATFREPPLALPPPHATALAPAADLSGGVAGLGGADVYLIFLESYGATIVEDEQHFLPMAPRFGRFGRHLEDRGFTIASNLIDSPTFGGGSWRAHATVLSGIRLADEGLYDQLVRSDRPTLVKVFKDGGYRTVAAEPAIQREWPEGAFFGFDRIYDAAALAYTGPAIGWWKIPDQFTLHRIYKDEISRPGRQPLFAKIALIMSHIPYFPVPPYVQDWTRFDAGTAYAQGMPSIAADDYRSLDELSSRYVHAFTYELDILEAFIAERVPASALVIISGDHQPPKLATHDNDSWAVPMHILSRNPELVRPFYAHGFRNGIVPRAASGFRMEDFLPAFLRAFRRELPAALSSS
jgi:hypothetical protein